MRSWQLQLLAPTGIVALLLTSVSSAALITTNELGMDAVFSQASFGANTVDIRFNPSITIHDTSLLAIDSEAKITTLFGLDPAALPTVNLFFVDSVDWCDGFNTGIVGCAAFPGNDIVVESNFAASGFGTELNSHELGHNLGLDHTAGLGLMGPSLNGQTTLTPAEVNTILASNLIQLDGSQRFVSITPVLIAASVPEPSSLALAGMAAIFLFGYRWRRRRQVS